MVLPQIPPLLQPGDDPVGGVLGADAGGVERDLGGARGFVGRIDAGLIVLTSFISPFRAERRMARSIVERDEFVEIFIDTPLAVAEERDVKGLYKKARAGEIKNFTGISSPYESPRAAEIVIDTTRASAEEAADQIVAWLVERGYLG